MEGKNPFVDVLDCTMRFLFIDHNTWFLALYRSNTGFIFLWLCHHSVTRWLARNTVWWEIFIWPWSALHFCVDNFHSSCCTSWCWDVNSGENTGRIRTGKLFSCKHFVVYWF